MIGGTPVYINEWLCETKFVRWRKSHRKARINKKWHKKYGAIYSHCVGRGYQMGGKLILCPCMAAALRKETA